jgi:signal transduction histidine kinase
MLSSFVPMATTRGASLDRGFGEAAERQKWATAALFCALAFCVAQLVLPERFIFLREELLYVGAEVAAIAAIVFGVHLYRPSAPRVWVSLAAGIGLFAIGDLIWGIYDLLDKNPFPSPADAFYLSAYVFLAAGFAVAARRRFAERDYGALLDAFVLTACVAVVFWVYLIEQLRATSDLSTPATLISIAYPIADLLLLAVVSRFLVGDAWRLPAFRTLAIAIALILVGDLSATLEQIGHPAISERWWNTMLLAGALLFGVAALQPSMRQLTEPIYASGKMPGLTRLSLIAIATLLPVAIRILQSITHRPLYLPVTITATVVIFVAALLRWSGLLRDLQRIIGRESRLRRFASDLLQTSGRAELESLAEQTAQDLVKDGHAELRRAVTLVPDDSRHVTAAITVRGEAVGELVAFAPSSEIRRVSEALPAIANQLSLALEREELVEAERRNAEQLAAQNEQLLELDKLKDQFVSTVSHELRTPLTSMIGYLEVTLDGEAGELNPEQKQFLETVNRNCARLHRLIDDILFMARLDSGRLSLDPSWVSLDEIADASVVTARVAAEKKGITLALSTEEGLPTVWADPIRLTQMLDNLISNAIKFTQADGTVRISVERRDEALHVEVADSGVGIPEEEVGKLFERFFRASTGVTAPGTGLGLSIVQSIVEVHGGTIDVKSTLDVGTTFIVQLPLSGIPVGPEQETAEVGR